MAINSGESIKASDVTKALTNIHLRSYTASSNDTTSLVFHGVVLEYRAIGLLLINANGIPKIYVCALFTDGTASNCTVNSTEVTITGVNTTEADGYPSARITIDGVRGWSVGTLYVTQNPL